MKLSDYLEEDLASLPLARLNYQHWSTLSSPSSRSIRCLIMATVRCTNPINAAAETALTVLAKDRRQPTQMGHLLASSHNNALAAV